MVGSLRARLLVVWVASLIACAVMAVLFIQLYAESSGAVAARAGLAGLRACDRLADNYGFFASGWDPGATDQLDETTRRGLLAVAQAAASFSGLSTGFWRPPDGVVAATPRPLASGEVAALRDAAEETLTTDATARRIVGEGDGVLLLTCPLRGPLHDLVGWARIVVADTPGLGRFRLGVGVLLALVLGISAWLTWLIAGWNRRVGAVEAALAGGGGRIPRTGLRELDRLVAALEIATARLDAARDRAAANERLAALGRVAAGVAHEIRNPVAAMRLRAENALAAEPQRRGAALEDIIGQIARLDRLIAELLEMTQRREPQCECHDVAAFLSAHAAAVGLPHAAVGADVGAASFDPAMVGRVLAILLDNSARHARGAAIRLLARHADDQLVLCVVDNGPGVPISLRTSLFEPFVTGSPDGTGLGLAIGRELAEAHGGQLRLVQTDAGAAFELELPWRSC